MNGDDVLRQERKAALGRWADTYASQFDRQLTDAWPDLEDRLNQAVDALSSYRLAVGAGEAFVREQIQPQVAAWFDRHVQPLLTKATTEFLALTGREPDWDQLPLGPAAEVKTTLCTEDLLRLAALPGGVGVGAAGTALAVKTAAVKIFWVVAVGKATVIAWPVLLVGLGLGAVLSWFGVHWLGGLHARFRERLKAQLYPQVKAALVGPGTERNGSRIPSLKDHLIGRVKAAARAAREQLEQWEVAP